MKVLQLSLSAAAATLILAAAGAAYAEDAPANSVAWNIGAATDYIFRGLDQTGAGSQGEVFGGVDATLDKGKFYLGNWDSTTGPSGDNGFEYDLYGGWKPTLGPVGFDVGFYYYGYIDSKTRFVSSKADTLEWKLGASTPIGPATVGVVTYYSSDNKGVQYATGSAKAPDTWYTEGDFSYAFKNKATFSAAYGYFDITTGAGGHYQTWNAGVTYPVTDKLSIDARYIGTDKNAAPLGGFNGGVATLKISF